MALSDPTNVRLGLARKQDLLKKLAAQMAAKGGGRALTPRPAGSVGGRAAGTGAQFASSVNLRTPGPARLALPFDLPNGRVRPGGFDPNNNGQNPWDTEQTAAPVIPGGPPAGGGGVGLTDPNAGAPTTVGADSVTYAGYPSQGDQIPTNPDTSGMSQADAIAAQTAANQAMVAFNANQAGASAPLNQAPDPYTMMASWQLQRILRGGGYGA